MPADTPSSPDPAFALRVAELAPLWACGAVRLVNKRKQLAERTEQSVITGVLTTQEDLHDAQ